MGGALFEPFDFSEPINRALQRALERGVSDEALAARIEEQVASAIPGVIEESASGMARTLTETAPLMLRDHRRHAVGFERRMRDVWGDALDLYYTTLVSCAEAGGGFNNQFRPDARWEQDYRFEALTLLHARACVVASDIYALLRTGHAFGAEARWRSLHEVAVVAMVLGDADQEVAERFLLHEGVQTCRLAESYALHESALNLEPIQASDLEAHRARRQELIERFGRRFDDDYGWAEPLVPKGRPTFVRLEELAGLAHQRPYYRLASHSVHADSKGAAQGRMSTRYGEVLLTGRTNAGLAEPGHGALISLLQVTCALFVSGRPIESPMVPVTLQALQILVDRAGDAFAMGADRVDALEEQVRDAEARGRLAVLAFRVGEKRRRVERLAAGGARWLNAVAYAVLHPRWLKSRLRP